jgi:polyisoprenoid-binding protein YceI
MTSTSTQAQRVSVPAAGRYRADPARSSVTFRTRHLFALGAVSGTMTLASGEITVDPAVPKTAVTAVVSAASFGTGSRARDRDVRSARFLDTARYPDITFRAANLTRADGRWTLAGELTVRDVTSAVTLAIESVERAGAGFVACATTRIDRYAFGVTAAKGMATRHLDITLSVTAEPWPPRR